MTDMLKGRRILIVEDEALVALLLETILDDMGCETVGPLASVAEALSLIERGEPLHAALLDVKVAGVEVFPVAAALDERGIPFAFSTGYGEGGLPEAWRGRLTFQKPFTDVAVQEVLMRALRVPA